MNPELRSFSDEQFRANRFEVLSRLADDLAHEIKNPLNAIVINLEVLKVRAARGDAASALERADVIEHETRRLHQLVDRLLQLMRPDREELATLALDQVLDELIPIVAAQVRVARNELITDCAVPVFIPVRRDIFKFAILNLVIAMHDVLGEGGGSLALRCAATDDTVTIRIAAEGQTAGSGPALERALTMAQTLLGPGGASVGSDSNGILVTLPRAAAV